MVDLVITRIDYGVGDYAVSRTELESTEQAEATIRSAAWNFSRDDNIKIVQYKTGFLSYENDKGATIIWSIDRRGAY